MTKFIGENSAHIPLYFSYSYLGLSNDVCPNSFNFKKPKLESRHKKLILFMLWKKKRSKIQAIVCP